MIMRYEWDERKRLSNVEKHGLDFFDVGIVFESPHIEVPSSHGSEKRFLAVGTLEGLRGGRLHDAERSDQGYFFPEGTS